MFGITEGNSTQKGKMSMKKITIENKTISNLSDFLKKTDADEITIRTSRVCGGWHDNEFAANRAGFNICRFINPEYVAAHTFAECYRITRK